MQNQQTVPRRVMRNRPYDLRKRVLLKNFLRAQNANQNFSMFNLAHFNAVPTLNEENGGSGNEEKERHEEPNSKSQIEASCVQGTRPLEHSQVNNPQNFIGSEMLSANASAKEISLQAPSDSKQLGTTEKCDFDAVEVLEVSDTDSPQMLTDAKQSTTGPKSSIQSKLSIKKPYTFCRKKSLRDPAKKKIRNGISKAKHGFKQPKSPSKRKFSNVRSAFSQMFSRKVSTHGIEEVGYDNRDRKEHGNFFAKLFKHRSSKPQPVQSSPSSATSSDKPVNRARPDFSASEYNLRSVSRSVQTDFSMCCHDFSFNRNSGNRFSCENRYCGPEDDPDRYQHKHLYNNKRRRYSDSSTFFGSDSFSHHKYPDSDAPKRMHNSLYCDDRYRENDFHGPRQVARSRSLSERPSSTESSRCQRSKSVRVENPPADYSFRSTYPRPETLSKMTLPSHHHSVTRSKDVFSENFLNRRYGLDVQHRSPGLLPSPPKQASSSVFRSSSMRESSRNSPLLRKNPMLCRRTRSVSDRYNLDRMASYYK